MPWVQRVALSLATLLVAFAFMLCRLFLLHHRVADAIDRLAMDPQLPLTDIVIVGDHMPPFFQRDGRVGFDGGPMPWIYLRAKDWQTRTTAPLAMISPISRIQSKIP